MWLVSTWLLRACRQWKISSPDRSWGDWPQLMRLVIWLSTWHLMRWDHIIVYLASDEVRSHYCLLGLWRGEITLWSTWPLARWDHIIVYLASDKVRSHHCLLGLWRGEITSLSTWPLTRWDHINAVGYLMDRLTVTQTVNVFQGIVRWDVSRHWAHCHQTVVRLSLHNPELQSFTH